MVVIDRADDIAGTRRAPVQRGSNRNPVLRRVPDSVPILLFHAIDRRSTRSTDRFATSPSEFSRHLDHIAETGRRVVRIADLVEARQQDANVAAVTFDDGYADTLATALPILTDRGMTASVYVTTSWIGTTRPSGPMLSVAGIGELVSAGVEVGSHAVHHVPLDRLPVAAVREELHRSRSTLEDIIGRPVRTFAYPHGHHTRQTRAAVIDAGFEAACAVLNRTSSVDDDQFALARLTVGRNDSVEDLDKMLRRRPAGRIARVRTALGSVRRGLRTSGH